MSPASAQSPASRVDDDDTLVYTMRDLSQQAASIFSKIERTGKPAFVTSHGRFVAVIRPLSPGQAESQILAAVAREVAKRAEDPPATVVTAHEHQAPALPAR